MLLEEGSCFSQILFNKNRECLQWKIWKTLQTSGSVKRNKNNKNAKDLVLLAKEEVTLQHMMNGQEQPIRECGRGKLLTNIYKNIEQGRD